jgi:ATP-dependent Clp protease ATP-binding subunit ClpA
VFSKLRRARTDIATMKRLFPDAERLAQADGLDRPGAEHLLLAALDLDDGTALQALGEMWIDSQQLHDAVIAQYDEALRGVGITADDNAIDARLPAPPERTTGPYRSQGSMQTLFQRAVTLAKSDGSPLRSGHLLLAATESEHGALARALTHLGIDRHELHDAARRHLEASTHPA